jgi:hypothetical protein
MKTLAWPIRGEKSISAQPGRCPNLTGSAGPAGAGPELAYPAAAGSALHPNQGGTPAWAVLSFPRRVSSEPCNCNPAAILAHFGSILRFVLAFWCVFSTLLQFVLSSFWVCFLALLLILKDLLSSFPLFLTSFEVHACPENIRCALAGKLCGGNCPCPD